MTINRKREHTFDRAALYFMKLCPLGWGQPAYEIVKSYVVLIVYKVREKLE